MREDELIDAFESYRLPPSEFKHRTHVELAWAYLRRRTLSEALVQLTTGLRRYAGHHGATGKYHETVTWAYVLLINERRVRGGSVDSFEDFAAANPDLFTREPPLLERYYRPETLASELAKQVFVFPDALGGG